MGDIRCDSTQEIKEKKFFPTNMIFDIVCEDSKEQHIANQMHSSAMEKGTGDETIELMS